MNERTIDMNDFNIPSINTSSLIRNFESIKIDTPAQHMWADEQFSILRKYIQEFEESLDSEHEVGIFMTNFGQSILMQVTQITYENPVLMVFKGFVNGKEATLLQHINQLNFLLTSVDKAPEKPKIKIGFDYPNE